MTNGIVKCINCNTLPKQHINKETKNFILKCPNCKIKTIELETPDKALAYWNKLNKKEE